MSIEKKSALTITKSNITISYISANVGDLTVKQSKLNRVGIILVNSTCTISDSAIQYEFEGIYSINSTVKIVSSALSIAESVIPTSGTKALVSLRSTITIYNSSFVSKGNIRFSHSISNLTNNFLIGGVDSSFSMIVLKDNRIDGGISGGIEAVFSNCTITGNIIVNGSVSGVTVLNSEIYWLPHHYGKIEKRPHTYAIIKNNIIANNAMYGIYCHTDNLIAENNTFIYNGKCNKLGRFIRVWWIIGTVVDTEGNEVTGDMTVTMFDRYGNSVNPTDPVYPEYKVLNDGTVVYYSPYKIVVEKEGYYKKEIIVTLNSDKNITIVLERSPWWVFPLVIVLIVTVFCGGMFFAFKPAKRKK